MYPRMPGWGDMSFLFWFSVSSLFKYNLRIRGHFRVMVLIEVIRNSQIRGESRKSNQASIASIVTMIMQGI